MSAISKTVGARASELDEKIGNDEKMTLSQDCHQKFWNFFLELWPFENLGILTL